MTDLRDRLPGSGAGIRVAVVDSGLNPHHSHVAPVADGVYIRRVAPGTIAHDPDWADRLGHGTAVGGAIRAVAPAAELLAVRIFGDRPGATVDQLVGAVRWAVQHGADVINLSLCSPDPTQESRLRNACRLALDHGVVVVAAGAAMPATAPEAIGVIAGDVPEFGLAPAPLPLDLVAHGHPRPLPGNRPNFRGHSFAAARVSGFIARLLSDRTGLSRTPAEIRNALCALVEASSHDLSAHRRPPA